ncbi:MAG: ABC transporter substrate-binding protein [Patescibacteria group bacterium]|nr:ABC transporter substrate-binding protein [Patescibacteria group bacterium]
MPKSLVGRLGGAIRAPFRFFGRLIKKFKMRKNISLPGAGTAELDRKLVLNLRKRRVPTFRQLRYAGMVMTRGEKIAVAIAALIATGAIITVAVAFYCAHIAYVPKTGGEYIEGLVGSPQFINPIYAPSNDVDLDITRLVYSGLVRITPDGGIEPELAESYETSEDGKTYTFRLRGDARWHDGAQVTADDVIFTFESIKNPYLASPLSVSFRRVSVEKVDDLTVKFMLDEPFAPFLVTLAVGILPRHLWEDVPTSSFQLAEYNKKPIGSGPYKFKSFTKDKKGLIHSFNLERNDNYYGKLPYIDKIIFKLYPTFEEGVNALNNKNIQGLSYLPSDSRDKIRGRGDLAYYHPSVPQYTALFFNQKKRTELKDINFRQALALATDKGKIVSEVLKSDAKVIDAPIIEGYLGYNPDIKKYSLNIDEANKLLDKTGWKFLSEGDTYRAVMTKQNNESGEEIEVRQDLTLTITTIDTAENTAVAEAIRGQWERIGIKVEIDARDRTDLERDIIKNQDYEILLFGEILGLDPDPYAFWHSSQISAGLNLALFANRDADKLLEEARGTTDVEARKEKYIKFQNILAETLPAIFLYSPNYNYPVTDKVRGINIQRMASPADRFSGIRDWYIKTKRAWN